MYVAVAHRLRADNAGQPDGATRSICTYTHLFIYICIRLSVYLYLPIYIYAYVCMYEAVAHRLRADIAGQPDGATRSICTYTH